MEASENTNYQETFMPIMVSQLMPYIDALDEYFGLGIRYFDSAIQYLYHMYRSNGKPIPNEEDTKVPIPLYVEYEQVCSISEKAGLTRENEIHQRIMEIFTLLANLIYDKEYEKVMQAIIESTDDEVMQYEDVRKDLLKLYLFINDPNTRPDSKISIKHMTGSVNLENHYGWFTRRMLKEYLAKYIPDITSLEQAKEALNAYKKQAGRKSADEREQILIYGIYRIFHEQTEMDSDLPDRLCEFIFEYLKLIKVYDEEDVLDMSTMRPTIRYIIKKPVQPKFGLGYEMEETSGEDLSKAGSRLY